MKKGSAGWRAVGCMATRACGQGRARTAARCSLAVRPRESCCSWCGVVSHAVLCRARGAGSEDGGEMGEVAPTIRRGLRVWSLESGVWSRAWNPESGAVQHTGQTRVGAVEGSGLLMRQRATIPRRARGDDMFLQSLQPTDHPANHRNISRASRATHATACGTWPMCADRDAGLARPGWIWPRSRCISSSRLASYGHLVPVNFFLCFSLL